MDIENINAERKKQQISIAELAERANLPKSTVEKVLFGIVKNPRLDTVQALEKALGLESTEVPEQLKKIPLALYEGLDGLSDEGMQDVIKYINYVKAKENDSNK